MDPNLRVGNMMQRDVPQSSRGIRRFRSCCPFLLLVLLVACNQDAAPVTRQVPEVVPSTPIATKAGFEEANAEAGSPRKEPSAADSSEPPVVPAQPEPTQPVAPAFRITKMKIDDARAAANGIRKIASRHLVLYTDLPSQPEVDELPHVFDLAVPQWCEYFEVPAEKVADWQMQGFLMKDRERFERARLLPGGLPAFLHGYNQGYELWVNEQESTYYRRHLLLHEGTHGFMDTMVGGLGPPWYAEGVAELLGTHRWLDDKLTLGYNPRSKEEVPDWGRVKLLRDRLAVRDGVPYSLTEIMELGPTAHRQVEPYAWCWAAAHFFDSHPEYGDWFRAMRSRVQDNGFLFNKRFHAVIRKERWAQAEEQWRLFMDEVDYGYDVERAAIEFENGQKMGASVQKVTIRADRGWQSSKILLERGVKYKISAQGRYQVGNEPKPWWCEPGGVTIRYYRGQPLGMLMAAIRDDNDPFPKKPYLSRSAPVGVRREITPSRPGTLYLRINESPRDLLDNDGELTVTVERM